MGVDKVERYEISYDPEGLHISMWQALPSLGFGLIVLVILAACFLTDPYQGHNRIWASLGVVALALVALFGVRVERWIISDVVIRYKASLWAKERVFERPAGTPLVVRVELVPCDSEGTQPPFPHVVHVDEPGGTEVGDGFRFAARANLDRFLQLLHEASPIG